MSLYFHVLNKITQILEMKNFVDSEHLHVKRSKADVLDSNFFFGDLINSIIEQKMADKFKIISHFHFVGIYYVQFAPEFIAKGWTFYQ